MKKIILILILLALIGYVFNHAHKTYFNLLSQKNVVTMPSHIHEKDRPILAGILRGDN